MKLSWLAPALRGIGTSILAMLLALALGGIIMLSCGIDPIKAYEALFVGAFGDLNSVAETMVRTTPLLLASSGVTLAFRGKIFNIGAEGQLAMGAIASAWVALAFPEQNSSLLIPLIVSTSFLAGGLWAAIPGLLMAKFNASEVLSTLMMNYIALLFMSYLVYGPLKEPGYIPQSKMIPSSARLPLLVPETRLNMAFIIALVCAVLVYALLWKTTLGYKIRAVGVNPEAARYGGINVSLIIVITMILSGGLAGLAGMGEVLGIQYRLKDGITMGYGFTAIVVTLLGKEHPISGIFAAILIGGLTVGANTMQYRVGVPVFLVQIIEGLVILFMLAGEYLSSLPQLIRRWRRS